MQLTRRRAAASFNKTECSEHRDTLSVDFKRHWRGVADPERWLWEHSLAR
jgi:hypothetical protein